MNAYSRHAWVVFALSLFTGTASASIPDANGVIHGCYNTLTGSTRIIDGNSCNLLEKSVNWSQTGPRGPAGASVTGVSLPVGDSHCPTGGVALTLSNSTSYVCNGNTADQIYMGQKTLHISEQFGLDNTKYFYFDTPPFTPSAPGAGCVYNFLGNMFDAPVGVSYQPSLVTNQGTQRILEFGEDAMAHFHSPPGQGTVAQVSTTAAWTDMTPGLDYKIGVKIRSRAEGFVTPIDLLVTWICKGGPNLTPN